MELLFNSVIVPSFSDAFPAKSMPSSSVLVLDSSALFDEQVCTFDKPEACTLHLCEAFILGIAVIGGTHFASQGEQGNLSDVIELSCGLNLPLSISG
jgi:hypothetical protein